jgi:hypothetical protein
MLVQNAADTTLVGIGGTVNATCRPYARNTNVITGQIHRIVRNRCITTPQVLLLAFHTVSARVHSFISKFNRAATCTLRSGPGSPCSTTWVFV